MTYISLLMWLIWPCCPYGTIHLQLHMCMVFYVWYYATTWDLPSVVSTCTLCDCKNINMIVWYTVRDYHYNTGPACSKAEVISSITYLTVNTYVHFTCCSFLSYRVSRVTLPLCLIFWCAVSWRNYFKSSCCSHSFYLKHCHTLQ